MTGIRGCAETLLRGVPSSIADELLARMVRETSPPPGSSRRCCRWPAEQVVALALEPSAYA